MELKPGIYTEIELVRMLCSSYVIRIYDRTNNFQGGKQRQLFLKELARHCIFTNEAPKQYIVSEVFDIPIPAPKRGKKKQTVIVAE